MGGSHADLSTLTLRNGTTRNNYFITLAEEEADLRISGFSLTSERMHTDNFSFIEEDVLEEFIRGTVGHCVLDEGEVIGMHTLAGE